MADTEICSVLNAIALGGVDTGKGIARVHAKATPTSNGSGDASLIPSAIGIIRFAVAVLLMTDDITHATNPSNSAVQ